MIRLSVNFVSHNLMQIYRISAYDKKVLTQPYKPIPIQLEKPFSIPIQTLINIFGDEFFGIITKNYYHFLEGCPVRYLLL